MDNNETNNSLIRPSLDNTVEYEEEEKSGVTLGQIFHMLRKHWVAIVITSLVGLAGGVVYGRFVKKAKYQATTQLMIVNTDTGSLTPEDTVQNISDAKNKAQILSLYMTSDEVKTQIAKDLIAKDGTKYDFYNRDENKNIIMDGTEYTYNLAAVSKLYSVNLQQVTSNNTSIFVTITSTATDSQLAIDVANTVSTSTITLCNTKSTYGYRYLKDSVASLGTVSSASDKSTSNIVIAAVGVLLGAVVGAGYGIIRELTNTHVSSKTELEQLTGYKVIGMIPKYDPYVSKNAEEGAKENA